MAAIGSIEGTPSLGPCCICRGSEDVHTVIMLDLRAPIPGHGWGCVVCNLPCDGAYAVICNRCVPEYGAGLTKLRFACRGYGPIDGRVSIDALTEPFGHDPSVDHG